MTRSRVKGSQATSGRRQRGVAWLPYALLIAVPLLALWPVTTAKFTTWDDLETVAENPRLESVSSGTLSYYWHHPAMDLYIPVTYSAWALLASMPQGKVEGDSSTTSTLNPVWFHSANLAVHVLSGLVVFGILRRLLRKDWPAVAGGLLFLLHPMQVESVAWMSGLKDVLAGMLGLFALYGYVRSITTSDKPQSRQWFVVATLTLVLALLAKPSAMVVPLAALVIGCLWFEQSMVAVLRRLWLWFGLAALCGILVTVTQPASHLIAVPLWRRLFVASDALLFYLRQFVWPAQLAVDYGRTPESVLSHWSGYATVVVVAAIALVAWYSRTRMREVWIGSALFVALLLPVLGLVPFDFQHYSTVADHYVYMALLGPALIAGAALSRAPRWGFAVMAIVLACLAVKSHAQTRTWQDGRTLFTHMVDVNPRSFLGHNNLGFEMVAAGAPADAIPHYQEAIRLFPGYRDAHANLGWVRSRLGDRQGAIEEYRQALAIDPDFLQARQGFASSLAAANQLEESLGAMRRVLELVPDSGVWHANTGAVLARLGRNSEAISEYEEALRLEPGMTRAVQALAVLKPKR